MEFPPEEAGASREAPPGDAPLTPSEHSTASVPDVGTDSFSSLPTICPQPPQGPPPTFNADAAELMEAFGLRKSPSSIIVTMPKLQGYVVESRLGRGGMGVVYKARDEHLKRIVAVKMLRAIHATPLDLARFEAEAVAVASIKHPNVVQVFDSGRHNSDPYFIMEYLAGGSLADRLNQRRFDPHPAAELVAKLADGVHAAHLAGLVHRDIKPSNVLFDEHDVPKVTDFGLAKHDSSTLTHAEAMLGTPAYMAPEQAAGQAKFVGPAADVYALGVLLYECLTGHRPFKGDNNWALLQQVQSNPPPAPSESVSGLPRDLELICLKCLEKDPADRYATAEALSEDLNRFLRGEPVTVRPTSAVVRAYRWARRDPKAAAFVAFAVLVLIGATAGLIRHEMRIDAEQAKAAEQQRARLAAEELARAKHSLAEAAGRARDEAEKSKAAAERLARNRELMSLLDRVRRTSVSRQAGWTWKIMDDLAASSITVDDPVVARNLRSVVAEAALSADIRPIGVAAGNLVPGAIAASPTSRVLAVAEKRPVSLLTPCLIQIVNSDSGRPQRELEFRAGFVRPDQVLELDSARCVSFTKSGTKLFVGTLGGWIHRYDLSRPESTPDKSWNAGVSIQQIEVAPDERRLYARCGPTNLLRVYDLDGQAVPLPRGKTFARCLAVHPIRGDIYIADGLIADRLDAKTLESDDSFPRLRHPCQDWHFTADGERLCAALGSAAVLLDSATLADVGEFKDPALHRGSHEDLITRLCVSPTGEYLATTSQGIERCVKVWQTGTERLVGAVTIPGTRPIHLAWSQDGRTLFATGMNETHRFDVRPPVAQVVVARQDEAVDRAAFTSDGEGFVTLGSLSTATSPQRRMLMRGRLDASSPTRAVHIGGNRSLHFGLSVQPGGSNVLVSSLVPGMRIWDGESSQVVAPFINEQVRQAAYDAEGTSIWAITERTMVTLWDVSGQNRRPVARWDARPAKSLRNLFTLDALAVGRERGIAGGSDGTIHVLDLASVTSLGTLGRAGDSIGCAAIRGDDRLAVAGTQSGCVVFVNLKDVRETAVVPAHSGTVTAAAFSRDGRYLATGSKSRSLRLWRKVGDWKYEPVLITETLPAGVRDLSFSPTDDRLMIVLDQEQAVRVWDIPQLQDHLSAAKMGW